VPVGSAVNHFDARVASPVFVEYGLDVGGGRGVVGDAQLPVRPGLRHYRFDGAPEPYLIGVIDRHEQRNQRRIRPVAAFRALAGEFGRARRVKDTHPVGVVVGRVAVGEVEVAERERLQLGFDLGEDAQVFGRLEFFQRRAVFGEEAFGVAFPGRVVIAFGIMNDGDVVGDAQAETGLESGKAEIQVIEVKSVEGLLVEADFFGNFAAACKKQPVERLDIHLQRGGHPVQANLVTAAILIGVRHLSVQPRPACSYPGGADQAARAGHADEVAGVQITLELVTEVRGKDLDVVVGEDQDFPAALLQASPVALAQRARIADGDEFPIFPDQPFGVVGANLFQLAFVYAAHDYRDARRLVVPSVRPAFPAGHVLADQPSVLAYPFLQGQHQCVGGIEVGLEFEGAAHKMKSFFLVTMLQQSAAQVTADFRVVGA